MKKILILLGIFISSVILFGSDNNNDEATVNITAEFLAPLNLEVVKHADFGTVIAQNYNKGNEPETITDGKLTVTGSGNVILKWMDSSNKSSPFHVSSDPLIVSLTNKDNDKLKAAFNVGANPKIKNDSSFNLTENKPHNLFVHGKLLDITSNTPSGSYTGSIIFRIEYDDSSVKY
ncbi:hypothetical protein [Fusobacterium sp.]|uniref:hypothetical protein n=1 Tax=Fusobacterium sp. TaxID=68766 RepID=UPI0029009912|nr:hypothetical protein [Fusobacterium sp.]MDU1910508.1 hypothetical protein [Fusobacterium sp.]